MNEREAATPAGAGQAGPGAQGAADPSADDAAPRSRFTLAVAAALGLVLLLQMVVFTVEDAQVAVVTTFGRPTAERSEPGLGFKWPRPIQRVVSFDARLRVLRAPLEEIVTQDDQAVLVGTFVLWRVRSARLLLEKVGDVPAAERQLERLLRSHQAAAISQTRFGELIAADRAALRHEEVERSIAAGVRAEAAALGIEVAQVGIRRLGLPREATEAVFERMREERHKQASEVLEAGRREADRIRLEAEAGRDRELSEARARASELLTQAEEAARPHYEALAEDSELAVFLKKLEALEQLLDRKTTLVFDSSEPPFDVLRGDVLRGDAPRGATAPVASPTTPEEPTPPSEEEAR